MNSSCIDWTPEILKVRCLLMEQSPEGKYSDLRSLIELNSWLLFFEQANFLQLNSHMIWI